jgi:cell pole-organizing protein PopZ
LALWHLSTTQGDETMSQDVKPTRRAILAGIAATVPAAPAVAALTVNPESPDADLLALGVQLDRIAEEVSAQRAIDQVNQDAFEAKVEERTGIAHGDAPAFDENDPSGYWEIRKAVAQDGTGTPDENNPWNPIHDRLFPLAEDILSRKAQTVAGLAVQTRTITMARGDLWDADLEPNEAYERTFIEAV